MTDNAHKAGDASGGALFSAAQRGDVDRVTALLAAADTREITVQEEMHGALQIAIRNDFPAVARVLCAAGAHFGLAVRKWTIGFVFPDLFFGSDEATPQRHSMRSDFHPIHLAASAGGASCIPALVSQLGVHAHVLDQSGDTPLHWACRYGHVDAIRNLLVLKADAGCANSIGDTPLDVAVIYGHIRCVKVLAASQLEEATLQSAARQECQKKKCAGLLARALRLHKAVAAE